MKIYLAGKIGPLDWRHNIIDRLEYANIKDTGDWPVWASVINGQHDYTGPFFAEEGHGVSHGDNQHGAMMYPDHSDQQIVFNRCKQAIKISGIVFAWIETTDCFGTIAEIGYAHALNKTICICGPKRFDDLWFVYSTAKHTSFIEETDTTFSWARDGGGGWHIPYAEQFLIWCADGPPNHREYINSAAWNTRANAAKERAGNRCQLCNRHRDHVILDAHHRTYERLGWELSDDITVLCRDCHELYESNKRAKREVRVAQPSRRNRRKR